MKTAMPKYSTVVAVDDTPLAQALTEQAQEERRNIIRAARYLVSVETEKAAFYQAAGTECFLQDGYNAFCRRRYEMRAGAASVFRNLDAGPAFQQGIDIAHVCLEEAGFKRSTP